MTEKIRKTYRILFLGLAVLLAACSNVQVLDSWKSENASSLRGEKVIVIARTGNKQARIAFESEIAKQLNAIGVEARESFIQFPTLKPNKKITEDEKSEIVEMLQQEGFKGAVLSVVKDVKESTKTVSSGGYYGGELYRGHNSGFHRYYHHPASYSTMGAYIESSTRTYTSTTFVLETVVYDLAASDQQQLIAVITSAINDPKSAHTAAKNYAKAIAESLIEE